MSPVHTVYFAHLSCFKRTFVSCQCFPHLLLRSPSVLPAFSQRSPTLTSHALCPGLCKPFCSPRSLLRIQIHRSTLPGTLTSTHGQEYTHTPTTPACLCTRDYTHTHTHLRLQPVYVHVTTHTHTQDDIHTCRYTHTHTLICGGTQDRKSTRLNSSH